MDRFRYCIKHTLEDSHRDHNCREFTSVFKALIYAQSLKPIMEYDWDNICLNLLRGIPAFINEYWVVRVEN